MLTGTTALKSFEGKVGAVVFDGKSFVTSPNADVIYAPPTSGRMTYQHDYRLGQHDPLLWPQPFLGNYWHLAAIPRAPEDLDENTSTQILFHKATDDDFARDGVSALNGLGHLSSQQLKQLKKVAENLQKKVTAHLHDDALPTKTPLFENVMASIKLSLEALEMIPMTRRQVLFVFSELQRYMLEFIAAHQYIYVFKPLFCQSEPPSEVANVVGAFVNSINDCDTFFRAGIPVWLIRPANLAGTVRVDSLVELVEPRDLMFLDDAYNKYRVFFHGSPTDPRKLQTFWNYSKAFLSYADPFNALPASEPSGSFSVPQLPSTVTRSDPPIRTRDNRKPRPCMFT